MRYCSDSSFHVARHHLSRPMRGRFGAVVLSLLATGLASAACSSSDSDGVVDTSVGGTNSSGGMTTANGGGTTGSGGTIAKGGASATGGVALSGGSGGTSSTGGTVGSGGASTGGNGTVGKGGTTSTGGTTATATGGATVAGGTTGAGGAKASGGATSTGGAANTGGAKATGGTATGGASTSGGIAATGGMKATGGSSTTGGATATGGSTNTTGADQCKPIGWATRSGRTGGAFNVTGGGTATPIVVTTFSDLSKYASDNQARVIHVDGTLGSGWTPDGGDRLEIGSNKTIIGLRPGTQLKAAIHINGSSNVILRNIVVRGTGSTQDQAWDNINIEGSSKNVWVDHCEFWDGLDGNADVVKGADTVTFTWNIFGYSLPGHDHNLSNLIASSDNEPSSEGKLDITFMFNWWKSAAQRQPRCRYGHIHVVNNLYTADKSVSTPQIGVNNGYQCNVLTENNHFIGQNAPISLDKEEGADSVQQSTGNLFESCTGNQNGSGTAFTPPYEYKSFLVPASQVRGLVEKQAGATLASPTSCQ